MFVEFDWLGVVTDSPILLVLLACSVVTFGIAIERLYYYRKRTGNADVLLLTALESLRKGKVVEAINFCRAKSHPLGVVAAETLECQLARPADTEETLQVTLSQQKLLLERNVNLLGTMAAVAPLIGLLGTVWGIMRAFHDMALTGSAAPSVVAAGVSEALVTTAAGLVIAVPAVLLFNHFNRRMNTMLTIAENHTRSLRIALKEAEPAHDRTSGGRPRTRTQQPAQPVDAAAERLISETVGSLAG